jgi:predicted phosphoribosyltransferase
MTGIIPYADRADAGTQLATALALLALERPVVLGIPRGGVPVAAEVARRLGGQLGVVVARKLGAPSQPELAVGAVSADGAVYVDDELARRVGASQSYMERVARRERAEAQRREQAFGANRIPLAGRNVIVVDDGIATGATAVAALRSVRAAGASRVVLAVPVGPGSTLNAMRAEADDVVCPHAEEDFFAVGEFYSDFRAPTDDEVRTLLRSGEQGGQPEDLSLSL